MASQELLRRNELFIFRLCVLVFMRKQEFGGRDEENLGEVSLAIFRHLQEVDHLT